MAEYIDRDKIIRAIMQWEDKPYFSYYAVLRDVMNLPSADVVERRHGKWNWVGFNIECSECGAMPNFDSTEPLYNFCPNCGADMRESEGEDG